MSKHREACGCTHDGHRWLSECSMHKAENDALHARALAEHRGTLRDHLRQLTHAASIPDAERAAEEASARIDGTPDVHKGMTDPPDWLALPGDEFNGKRYRK